VFISMNRANVSAVAGSAIGGALGATAFTNISSTNGALIGLSCTGARAVARVVLNRFNPEWTENVIFRMLQQSAGTSTMRGILYYFEVPNFRAVGVIATTIATIEAVVRGSKLFYNDLANKN
jgi:lauroyl/myristoyl acyltransferase